MWRYSRIHELDLDDYTLVPPAVPTVGESLWPAPVQELLDDFKAATLLVAVNGTTTGGRIPSPLTDLGLEVGGIAETEEASGLGSVMAEPADVLGLMNDAFSTQPLRIRIPAGMRLDEPIVVVNWIDVAGGAIFPRLVVEAGPDSEAAVIDITVSPAGTPALVVPVVELDVQRGARLGYVNQQLLGPQTWQIGSQVSRVGQEAQLVSATVGFGGDYARQRTDCRMAGRGSSSQLLAIYFGEGDQTLDFRTFQDHAAPDTRSELLYKGVVGGASRSVYTGLIRVRKDARGTDAIQTNRNIKLSEDAWAESVPNLEIENNDVRCSHASAVGPIDEEQRFYLESRGVPTPAADRLIVTGFFDEVLQRLPARSLIAPLRAAISAKLSRTTP